MVMATTTMDLSETEAALVKSWRTSGRTLGLLIAGASTNAGMSARLFLERMSDETAVLLYAAWARQNGTGADSVEDLARHSVLVDSGVVDSLLRSLVECHAIIETNDNDPNTIVDTAAAKLSATANQASVPCEDIERLRVALGNHGRRLESGLVPACYVGAAIDVLDDAARAKGVGGAG